MKNLIFCFCLVLSVQVYGTQFRGGDNVVVRSDEAIEDDLFIGANRLTIMGTVDGDLIAGARNIGVYGEIWGDLTGGAEYVFVSGRINDDLRVAAREVTITGKVASNALCLCKKLRIKSESEIGRDLTVYAGEAEIEGRIGGNLKGAANSIRIGGKIDGSVDVTTSSLVILPTARILGDIIYTSKEPAEISQDALIRGQVVHRVREESETRLLLPRFTKVFHRLKWIFKIIFLIASLIVGLLLVKVAPVISGEAAHLIRSSPWKCIGLGLLVLVVVPIAVLIVSLTGIGLPLGIIVFFLYLIFLYLSSIIFGIFIGKSFFGILHRDISPYWALIFGMIVLFFLSSIPWVGWIIKFVVILFGFGAILLIGYRKHRELKEKGVV